MSSPTIKHLTVGEAQAELEALEAGVYGGIEDFEIRARNYELAPQELGTWQRISELRWLLGIA